MSSLMYIQTVSRNHKHMSHIFETITMWLSNFYHKLKQQQLMVFVKIAVVVLLTVWIQNKYSTLIQRHMTQHVQNV